MLRLVCPGCDKTLGVPATAAGKPSTCPACATRFLVPADAEPEPAPAPRPRARVSVTRDDGDEDDDRPRRPIRRRPHDEDDESVARGRRVDDDDEDDEEDDRPARGRRVGDEHGGSSRKSKRRRNGALGWYLGPLGRVAENAVVTVVLALVSVPHPWVGVILLTLWAGLVMTAGGLWFAAVTLQDGLGEFFRCAVVPFHSLFYAISNWQRVKQPVTLQFIGFGQMLVVIALMFANGLAGSLK